MVPHERKQHQANDIKQQYKRSSLAKQLREYTEKQPCDCLKVTHNFVEQQVVDSEHNDEDCHCLRYPVTQNLLCYFQEFR